MNFELTVHENAGEMAEALAKKIAQTLSDRIKRHGAASIALSGGSTPGPMMSALSFQAVDWQKVVVTLTDERCVPSDHERSNHRLLQETLLDGPAGAAKVVPLYDEGGLDDVNKALREHALPLDIAVFGMGTDLHTASLFPGADGLENALDTACTDPVAKVVPTTGEEPRISLTAPAIITARRRILMLRGADKRAALDRVLSTYDVLAAPSRLLFTAPGGVAVHYAP